MLEHINNNLKNHQDFKIPAKSTKKKEEIRHSDTS